MSFAGAMLSFSLVLCPLFPLEQGFCLPRKGHCLYVFSFCAQVPPRLKHKSFRTFPQSSLGFFEVKSASLTWEDFFFMNFLRHSIRKKELFEVCNYLVKLTNTALLNVHLIRKPSKREVLTSISVVLLYGSMTDISLDILIFQRWLIWMCA